MIRVSGMGTGLGEPVGACRLSRAVPGCALPARGSRGLPLGVAPPPLCSAREPGGSRGRWGHAGGERAEPTGARLLTSGNSRSALRLCGHGAGGVCSAIAY